MGSIGCQVAVDSIGQAVAVVVVPGPARCQATAGSANQGTLGVVAPGTPVSWAIQVPGNLSANGQVYGN